FRVRQHFRLTTLRHTEAFLLWVFPILRTFLIPIWLASRQPIRHRGIIRRPRRATRSRVRGQASRRRVTRRAICRRPRRPEVPCRRVRLLAELFAVVAHWSILAGLLTAGAAAPPCRTNKDGPTYFRLKRDFRILPRGSWEMLKRRTQNGFEKIR